MFEILNDKPTFVPHEDLLRTEHLARSGDATMFIPDIVAALTLDVQGSWRATTAGPQD